MQLPMSARTAATEQRYQDDKANGRTIGIVHEPAMFKGGFKYFKIIENRYPYDAIFGTHHILVIRRQCANEADFTVEERRELQAIKFAEFYKYHTIMENYRAKSVSGVWHLHLCNYLPHRPVWLYSEAKV